MNNNLSDRIAAFLAGHHVLSLATHSPDGPHAASLFYACDGLSLLWLSEPDTRHSLDIATDARVAATIAPDYTNFTEIRGMQVFGTARRIVDSGERQRHLALLDARYPFLYRLKSGPPKLQEGYARASPYRLEPLRMVLIDNTKGFGHKETAEFPPERPAHG